MFTATQPEVGYGWIKLKLEKDYKTAKDAEKNTKVAPAVVGPSPDGPRFYIVDDHHTLCALDYSGHEDITVVFDILCDKRDWSDDHFWESLANQNLAYLGAHPTDAHGSHPIQGLPLKIHWSDVPKHFSFTKKEKSLADDPWRSLAGYSRKVENDVCPKENPRCMRCMYRGCKNGYSTSKTDNGVAFFEFRWAYFMTVATYYSPNNYWSDMDDFHSFIKAFDKVYNVQDVDEINTANWQNAAAAVVPLCRSENAGKYELPSDIYALLPGTTKNTLPGYYAGDFNIPADPECASPSCAIVPERKDER